MFEDLVQVVSIEELQEWHVELLPYLWFSYLFGLLALGEGHWVLVLTQDVEVMVPWGKEGENDTEGMLIGHHEWEKILYLREKQLFNQHCIIYFC